MAKTRTATASGRPKRRFVDNYLLYLLALASHQASGEFHAQLKALGVPVMTWRVLGALDDVDGETVSALARDVLVNQPTLTKIIDRMARDGLVERCAAAGDRRKVLVRITERGRAMVADLKRRALAHEAEVLAGYDAAEAARLKDMLLTLIARSRARRPA
ncbi:MAG TPA: MarR family transcriptional regulator [Alphaproteobacteria bacterium]|jgi:DNA-binding MarR family transcriptional regulator